MMSTSLEERAKKFWETDLDKLEESFLKGKKVTELPIRKDSRVPAEGSIMLDRIIDIDKVVPKTNPFTGFFLRLFYHLKHLSKGQQRP